MALGFSSLFSRSKRRQHERLCHQKTQATVCVHAL